MEYFPVADMFEMMLTRSEKNADGRYPLNCWATELTIVLAEAAGDCEIQFLAASASPSLRSLFAHACSSCINVTELPVKELVTEASAASSWEVRLDPIEETSPYAPACSVDEVRFWSLSRRVPGRYPTNC